MINMVRQRAAYRKANSPAVNAAAAAVVTTQPSDVTLDFILNGHSREFFGKWQRWDLIRTQSFVRRTGEWNPEAHPYIKLFHSPGAFRRIRSIMTQRVGNSRKIQVINLRSSNR
jgi:hypothetical protein